jgi:hypothetical protein
MDENKKKMGKEGRKRLFYRVNVNLNGIKRHHHHPARCRHAIRRTVQPTAEATGGLALPRGGLGSIPTLAVNPQEPLDQV